MISFLFCNIFACRIPYYTSVNCFIATMLSKYRVIRNKVIMLLDFFYSLRNYDDR